MRSKPRERTLQPRPRTLSPDLAQVAASVQAQLPGQGSPWRVCVLHQDGAPTATFTFHSYEQVLLFERHMERFGYGMLMLDERFRLCDFALTSAGGPMEPAPLQP